MTTNFKIEDWIAITISDKYFDLHNNFDFIKYEYHSESREFTLYFQKNTGIWAKDEKFELLKLNHKKVTNYKLATVKNDMSGEDSAILSTITFIPNKENNLDVLMNNKAPHRNGDILYIFEDKSYIRISCEEILLFYK